jgi:hypothetical protein
MNKNWEKQDDWSANGSPQSFDRDLNSLSETLERNERNTERTSSLQVFPEKQSSSNRAKMPKEASRHLPSWLSWQLLGTLMVLIATGIGLTATSLLLNLPKKANCTGLFLPTASASNRLYCAELKAEEKKVESLLAAINLVEVLPEDHPLRPEINQKVEQWAQEILDLAQTEFQAGDLQGAIEIAQKIPKKMKAYSVVDKRIARWQETWDRGAKIFAEVEKQLRQSNWNQAFRVAVQLANINNDYWSSIKYQEIVDHIQIAREESAKLEGAYAKLRRGGLENILEAISQARQIDAKSYAYKEAQDLIDDAKNKILKLGQAIIEKRNWGELADLASKIPENLDLETTINDWNTLASAGTNASMGTVEGLETAIGEIEKLDPKSSVYNEAQELIGRWKLEIEDVAHLAKARELAQIGDISNLTAAINEAELIPRFNPRYEEAQKEIKTWTSSIQTIQDRPYLARARELALNNDLLSWKEAISQASLISANRALYKEAQQEIRTWRKNIETQEDRPIIEEAKLFAEQGDYSSAIKKIQIVKSGRALSKEAQSNLRNWRREVQSKTYLTTADKVAQKRTPEALIEAISIARQVYSSSKVYQESLDDINRWSSQLLAIAQDKANYSLENAIDIARKIPSGTDAYAAAREQIKIWRKSLEPTPVQSGNTEIKEIEIYTP